MCGAARALHSGRPNWLDLASIDADLLRDLSAKQKHKPECSFGQWTADPESAV
jgi:hypothetical protein